MASKKRGRTSPRPVTPKPVKRATPPSVEAAAVARAFWATIPPGIQLNLRGVEVLALGGLYEGKIPSNEEERRARYTLAAKGWALAVEDGKPVTISEAGKHFYRTLVAIGRSHRGPFPSPS